MSDDILARLEAKLDRLGAGQAGIVDALTGFRQHADKRFDALEDGQSKLAKRMDDVFETLHRVVPEVKKLKLDVQKLKRAS